MKSKNYRSKTKAIGKDEKVFIGEIDGTSKGYGFFMCPDFEEDIFIPAHRLNGAQHGDKVSVRVMASSRGGSKSEGEVAEIMSRGITRFVGTFIDLKTHAVIEPDDARIGRSIKIKKDCCGKAEQGDKVVAEFIELSRVRTEAKIVEVLGKPEDKYVDMLSIIRAYNLYETFPKTVLKEADEIEDEVSENQKAGRVDFSGENIITIDGDDSRDFDDAVCVKKTIDGYELQVHIADVAEYVKAGSRLDKEALKRGTSVYFPDMVLPMLPKKLSNGICSLNEGVDRLTLGIVIQFDNSGTVLKHKISEGVINSHRRMTYKKVDKILEGDPVLCAEYSDIVPMLGDMKELSQILTKKRLNRGNIEFEISESEIILDENGKTADVVKKTRLISHRIIEEFMLAANETIAEHFCNIKAPFVYRAHENPPAEKLEGLIEFLKALGISNEIDPDNVKPSQFSKMLAYLPDAVKPAVNRVSLRSMSKAFYSPQNIGHFGLAAEFYCHFTSPIRRYPDLAIHRIIKDYLKNGRANFSKFKAFTVEASDESSVRERLAEKAERDVDDLKKAEFMLDKIGLKYEGVISSVTEFGFFVELDNSVEGLVRLASLNEDSLIFNPKSLSLSGGGKFYRIGDRVNVVVEGVNRDKVSFTLDN